MLIHRLLVEETFMPRALLGSIASFLLLAGIPACSSSTGTPSSPYSGTWKMTVRSPGQDMVFWLLQIEDQEGKLEARVIAAGDPQLQEARVEAHTDDDR